MLAFKRHQGQCHLTEFSYFIGVSTFFELFKITVSAKLNSGRLSRFGL